jgi:drug/metabolite transporter (DMT)-like permease
MRYTGVKLDLKTNFKEVTIRNIIFLLQAFGMAFVQFYLPLSIIHTIGSTGPIYVCVYQYFIEGKKLNVKQVTGMTLAILGILLTTNGRLLSHLLNPD